MSLIGALIGVIVAAVVFWLLSYAVPVFIAALVALGVFLLCVFAGPGVYERRRGL